MKFVLNLPIQIPRFAAPFDERGPFWEGDSKTNKLIHTPRNFFKALRVIDKR
jgi:hypothetical protein